MQILNILYKLILINIEIIYYTLNLKKNKYENFAFVRIMLYMILFDIWICISALVDCFGEKKFEIIIWKCQLWWLKICSTVIYADATTTTAWFGHIYGQYHKVQYTTYLHIVWCEKKIQHVPLLVQIPKKYTISILFLYDFLVHKTKYSENLKK